MYAFLHINISSLKKSLKCADTKMMTSGIHLTLYSWTQFKKSLGCSLWWNGATSKNNWAAQKVKHVFPQNHFLVFSTVMTHNWSCFALMSSFIRVGNMKWDELWGETDTVVPQGKFAGKKIAARSLSLNNNNYPEDKRRLGLGRGTSGSQQQWEIQLQKNRRKSKKNGTAPS